MGAWAGDAPVRGAGLATRRPRAPGEERIRLSGWKEWGAAAGIAAGLVVGVFLLYFLVYRVRHFALPLGWDTPWYVWRAEFVAHEGLGPLGTDARPGHALLSAVLGAVTTLSQLQLQVVVPYVLVGMFALAVGGLAVEGMGTDRARWVVAIAVAGALVGATRLVGENVANVLHLLLVVAGLTFLIRMVARGRGFLGSVLLLVAAGLAHWLFLGLTGAVLVVWFALALLRLRRERQAAVPLLRTEAGAVASVGAATGAAMAAIIYPVLGSSLSTFEIQEAERRFLPKLTKDLGTLWLPALGPVAVLGAVTMVREATGRSRGHDPEDAATAAARRSFLKLIGAWTFVCAVGLAVSAVTLELPPHRFLTLLVAVPGFLSVAAAILAVVRWGARRAGRVTAALLGAAAVGALAVPGATQWYGPADLVDGVVVNVPADGPEQWFDVSAFEQARAAAAYMQTLPMGTTVVFLVGPRGASGPISVALKERTIRAALPPHLQEDAYVYPGLPQYLLAGRRTPVGDPEIDRANLPYWERVQPVLNEQPTLIAVRALGPEVYDLALESGAAQLSPGTALLRGHQPASFEAPPVVRPVPTVEVGVLWAAAAFAVMAVAGVGWTVWLLGDGAPTLAVVSLTPAVGAGALIIGALAAAKIGIRLAGTGGRAVFIIVAVAGAAVAAISARRR
jgi:hypothetical protein